MFSVSNPIGLYLHGCGQESPGYGGKARHGHTLSVAIVNVLYIDAFTADRCSDVIITSFDVVTIIPHSTD